MSLSVDNKDGEPSISFKVINKKPLQFEDMNKLEIKISNLIHQRGKKKAEIVSKILEFDEKILQTETYFLEQKLKSLKSSVDNIFCEECNQIENLGLRQKLLLHQIHGEILYDKPNHLLCTFGLFKQFETMALKGLMDVEYEAAKQCSKCDQIIEVEIPKKNLMSHLLVVLDKTKSDTDECSVENCCQKCKTFVESFLKLEISKPENAEPHPSIFDNKNIESRDYPDDTKLSRFSSQISIEDNSYNPFVQDMVQDYEVHAGNNFAYDETDATTMKLNSENIPNKTKNIVMNSNLEKEINSLKLLVSNLNIKLNEQALELKQQKIKIASLQSITTEESNGSKIRNVSLSTPYTIGKDILLSNFSAKPEEDPHVVLQMWEVELTKCGIPQEDWTFFISRSLEGTAKGWWRTQGCGDDLPWEDFRSIFLKSFGRVELRRWLTYAGNLCLSAPSEPIGTYITTRFQIILRAMDQDRVLALALIEKHLNTKLGKFYVISSFEDFYFLLVAEQVIDFNATKLLFHHVLAEIRDNERFWK